MLATLARDSLYGSPRGLLKVLELLTLSVGAVSRWSTVFATHLPRLIGDSASSDELTSQAKRLEARRAACSTVARAWSEATSACTIVAWDEFEPTEAEVEEEKRWDDRVEWHQTERETSAAGMPNPAQGTSPAPVSAGLLLLQHAHDAQLVKVQVERRGHDAANISKVSALASRFADELIKGVNEAAAAKAFGKSECSSLTHVLEHAGLLPHLRSGGSLHLLELLAEAAADLEPLPPPPSLSPATTAMTPSSSPPLPSPLPSSPLPQPYPPTQPPLPPPSQLPPIPPPVAPAATLQELEQIVHPRWFRDAVTAVLRPVERANAQRIINEACAAAMATEAAGDAAREADEAQRRQFALGPIETWSLNAQRAVELAEKGDTPASMGPACAENWTHMSPAQKKSYAVIAVTLRSVREQIGVEHGRWDEAAAKEYRAVLNSIEAVMNRRLEFAGAKLVRGPT